MGKRNEGDGRPPAGGRTFDLRPRGRTGVRGTPGRTEGRGLPAASGIGLAHRQGDCAYRCGAAPDSHRTSL